MRRGFRATVNERRSLPFWAMPENPSTTWHPASILKRRLMKLMPAALRYRPPHRVCARFVRLTKIEDGTNPIFLISETAAGVIAPAQATVVSIRAM